MHLATLDIETLNGVPNPDAAHDPKVVEKLNGLDPACSTVTSVQIDAGAKGAYLLKVGRVEPVAFSEGGVVRYGTRPAQRRTTKILGRDVDVITVSCDRDLLTQLDTVLYLLKTEGVTTLAGWNSSVFDFPYLYTKAYDLLGDFPSPIGALGIKLGHRLDRTPKYEALNSGRLDSPSGVYTVRCHGMGHIDAAYAYRKWCDANEVRWSLKPFLEARGHAAPDADVTGEKLHLAAADAQDAYAMFDVFGLRDVLIEDARHEMDLVQCMDPIGADALV